MMLREPDANRELHKYFHQNTSPQKKGPERGCRIRAQLFQVFRGSYKHPLL